MHQETSRKETRLCFQLDDRFYFKHQKLHTGRKTPIWKEKKRQEGKTMIRMSVGVAMKWQFGVLLISNILIHWREDLDLLTPSPRAGGGGHTWRTPRSNNLRHQGDKNRHSRSKDPILAIWAESLLQFNRIKRIKYSCLHIYTAALRLCIHL